MDPDLKDLIAYLRVRHRTLRCGPLARTALLFEHITDPEMLRNPHFVGARRSSAT